MNRFGSQCPRIDRDFIQAALEIEKPVRAPSKENLMTTVPWIKMPFTLHFRILIAIQMDAYGLPLAHQDDMVPGFLCQGGMAT